MLNLILTILLTSSLFLIFKTFPRFRVNTFQAIIVNYLTCFFTGLFFLRNEIAYFQIDLRIPWLQLALVTGLMFVITFNLIALTVEKISVSAATVANKMSLIIPVIFSLLFIESSAGAFSFLNYSGLMLGLLSIPLAAAGNPPVISTTVSLSGKWWLPLLIFFLGGIIDMTLNFVNYKFLDEISRPWFPVIAFLSAAIAGIILLTYKVMTGKVLALSFRSVAAGFILGIPNYFSVYFLLKALADFNHNGALVFPALNIGIILFSALIAAAIFRERLSRINITGIIFAVIAIVLVFI